MTAPLDPDRFPDVRPDRLRFWTLRLLAWVFVGGGLVALGVGLAHGWLAYYATKNGGELERVVGAASWFLAAAMGGLVAIAIGQIARVVLAIEENTRLIAFNTQQQAKAGGDRRPVASEKASKK